MNKDIKARVERLVGPDPTSMRYGSNAENGTLVPFLYFSEFIRWKQDFIERLAGDAKVMLAHAPKHLDGRAVWISKPYEDADSTHTCLALDFQPIKRGVTKDEVVKFITALKEYTIRYTNEEVDELLKRIESEGIVP